MALNDHTDWRWDERVLRSLASLDTSFRQRRGQREWVDAPGRDSCHIVWIQFHEDLLATLGIPRGSDI